LFVQALLTNLVAYLLLTLFVLIFTLACSQPPDPLALMQRLKQLMKQLVDQLAALCKGAAAASATDVSPAGAPLESTTSVAPNAGGEHVKQVVSSPVKVAGGSSGGGGGAGGGSTGAVGAATSHYSSQNQAPEAWQLHRGVPCGGEKLVLLHDRYAPVVAVVLPLL
jgi:hypothetical protein